MTARQRAARIAAMCCFSDTGKERCIRDEISMAIVEAVKESLAPYRWRPVADIHEDYGFCVLMNLDDPGYLEIGSNLDTDFDESQWTHFAEVPKLSSEEADELEAAMQPCSQPENRDRFEQEAR